MQSKISFIAPCYNGESYIKRFLDSILNQTYNNVQLVIINDGSEDDTEKILTEYEKDFFERGFEYIHLNQENKGIGGAINDALKHVTGEYMTWFGTDDFACETYAEELVSFLDNHKEFAVVRNDGFLVREGEIDKVIGRMSDGNNDKHNPHLFENAIMERNFHFGYSVVRMSVFDLVNPKREIYPSRQGQNWQLLLPIFYHYKSAFYEKPLYYVIDDSNSVSREPLKSYDKLMRVTDEYEKILVNVLNGMEIPDRQKYLDMVKVKYLRYRMMHGINFGHYDTVISNYKALKKITKITISDRKKYWRAKLPFINRLIKK